MAEFFDAEMIASVRPLLTPCRGRRGTRCASGAGFDPSRAMCPSTPSAATPSSRSGSSTIGRPWVATARITVCQPTPRSAGNRRDRVVIDTNPPR